MTSYPLPWVVFKLNVYSLYFASGQAAAADDESENEFDESDLAPPDDSDGMDFDDFDDY